MVLTKFTGSTQMDGSEDSLFKVVGTTMKHFASYVYLKALQAGEQIRLRVYNKVDDVSHWKLDGDVTDSVGSNNGTVTNISSLVSQWKFDGNVNDSVGANNGTITYHTNLKRLYKFESNLNDSTTAAANGTLGAGSATYVTGKEGNAFSFTGTEYITASDTGLQTVNGAWSVTGWIYPTSFAANRYIYSYGTNAANQAITISTNTSGKIVVGNVTGALLTSTLALQLNTWYHIEVTYNGTTLTIYINSVSDSTATPAALNITLAGASGQHIGANINNTSPFVGYIDELRNYNIALSQDQVSALYMNGKFGQSHTFDGGEYITMANESQFDFERTNPLSISFWFKSTVGGGRILTKNTGNNTTGIQINLSTNPGIFFKLTNTNTTNQIEVDSATLNILDGVWHHCVITYSGSSLASGVLIYIDGVSVSTSTIADNLSASILNNNPVVIGANGDATQLFNGQLDDVRVYSSALSDSQVLGLYNYTGSNYVTPLPVGNALSLDGSSYMTIGKATPFNWERTQAFSTSFWAKFTDNNVKGIMGNSNAGQGWSVDTNTGSVELMLRNTASTNELRVRTTNTYNDGNWHNYVITYSGNSLPSGINIYVDGVLVGMTTVTNNLSATTIGGTFGVGSFGTGTLAYIGLIDEVQIWNYVLSSSEINAINAGRFGNTHPIGLWHFDGDLYDYSGQGSTGLPTGTMTYVTGALSGSYNVPNTHFNFDGSEFLDMGNPSNLGFDWNNPFTITFWINSLEADTNVDLIVKGVGFRSKGISVWKGASADLIVDIFSASNVGLENEARTLSIYDGTWHFVAITYDGKGTSNSIQIYIDNVVQAIINNGFTSVSASIITSNNFRVCADSTGANVFAATRLDDLRVYNRALSSAEVSDLYTYPDSAMKQLVYDKTYSGVRSDAIYIPFLQGNDYMVTATQSGGTNRIVSWEREESQ